MGHGSYEPLLMEQFALCFFFFAFLLHVLYNFLTFHLYLRTIKPGGILNPLFPLLFLLQQLGEFNAETCNHFFSLLWRVYVILYLLDLGCVPLDLGDVAF